MSFALPIVACCALAGVPVAQRAYTTQERLPALEARWAGTGLARSIELGTSYGGRRMVAFEVGAPGPVALSERPTILLLGAPDGVSLAGNEAVVAILDHLTANPSALPKDVTFLAVPWANPDGSARRLAGGGWGANDRPVDEDADGRFDEDGPDDVSGEGFALEMLLEDARGTWVRAADGRSLRLAEPGEAPRFLRLDEGKDDDGDGVFNEDGPGGVVTDRNFPVAWQGAWTVPGAGSLPLSEPSSRALAELVDGRRVALALVLQGNHGTLVQPGGDASLPAVADDAPIWRALGHAFARAFRRAEPTTPRLDAVGGRGGSVADWLYYANGIATLELAPWGLCVTQDEVRARNGAFASHVEPRRRGGDDARWCAWIDETRGGIGFLDWEPIQLDDGRTGYVGGWEPRTRDNPPAEELQRALGGVADFVIAAAHALPRFKIEVKSVRHEGALAEIVAHVRNYGGLSSRAGPRDARPALHLGIELGGGARLAAGAPRSEVGELDGGALSEPISWWIVSEEGTPVRLVLDGPGIVPVIAEVRP
ncbi:MAG: M14 family zinc carboxypeptidase [Planctomycetota bacterium]